MLKKTSLFGVLFIAILFSACKDKYDEETFGTEMEASLGKDSDAKISTKDITGNVYAIYKKNNFQPVWITEKDAVKRAKQMLEELKELSYDGIPASRYNIEELEQKITSIDKEKGMLDTKVAIEYDKMLTETYVKAAYDLMYGILDPDDAGDMWYHDNDSAINIATRLDNSGYTTLDNFRSKIPLYRKLVDKAKNLDNTENSPENSRQTIFVNLERLRWLPQNFEESYVIAVVPVMELFLVENGNVKMNMRAIVGDPDHETPTLNADMKNVVFNPSWGIPPGIMKREVVPQLLSQGENYLDRKGYVVTDRQGNEVPASAVTNDNYRNFIVRQPPSERNALGQVKFDLPNPYAIYLHDTPNRTLFDQDNRALSHGCIRVHQPRELADYILTEMNDKDYDINEINEIVSHNETEYVKLKHRLPVHIVYLTAYDKDGKVKFYNDIYGRDKQIAGLLR